MFLTASPYAKARRNWRATNHRQLLSQRRSSSAGLVCGWYGRLPRRAAYAHHKDLGQVAIGLGLVLLALHVLIDTLAPAENAPSARVLLGAITGDPVMCILLAAALTWAAHSSVAIVLLIMSLAYSNFITPLAALASCLALTEG